jgi:hypothetical protein
MTTATLRAGLVTLLALTATPVIGGSGLLLSTQTLNPISLVAISCSDGLS